MSTMYKTGDKFIAHNTVYLLAITQRIADGLGSLNMACLIDISSGSRWYRPRVVNDFGHITEDEFKLIANNETSSFKKVKTDIRRKQNEN